MEKLIKAEESVYKGSVIVGPHIKFKMDNPESRVITSITVTTDQWKKTWKVSIPRKDEDHPCPLVPIAILQDSLAICKVFPDYSNRLGYEII